jgi:hypothetical protein
MKFKILIIFFCIKVKCSKFELGKVSIGTLEKKHPKDSAAVAAIL